MNISMDTLKSFVLSNKFTPFKRLVCPHRDKLNKLKSLFILVKNYALNLSLFENKITVYLRNELKIQITQQRKKNLFQSFRMQCSDVRRFVDVAR